MVEVDFDLCEANGVCVGLAPEVFDLNDDDELIVSDADGLPENRDAIEEAIAGCPRAALQWKA
ncbi:MAG: ferredoxin [Rhodococcus sp. (in: high G+C Gram-positive bacteria)]